jgi:hypothetical protein
MVSQRLDRPNSATRNSTNGSPGNEHEGVLAARRLTIVVADHGHLAELDGLVVGRNVGRYVLIHRPGVMVVGPAMSVARAVPG